MKGYTTKTALENYTLQAIDASFVSQITSWIESIEKFIDLRTGRNFIADEVASEKKYDGDGAVEILVDDFIELTKLEVGELEATRITVDADDYRIYPTNELPKRKIQLKSGYFTTGGQNIVITAKWGYSEECPADITLAATTLLAGVTGYSDDSKGKVKSESVGQYSVSYKTDQGWQDFKRAIMILDSYKKFHF